MLEKHKRNIQMVKIYLHSKLFLPPNCLCDWLEGKHHLYQLVSCDDIGCSYLKAYLNYFFNSKNSKGMTQSWWAFFSHCPSIDNNWIKWEEFEKVPKNSVGLDAWSKEKYNWYRMLWRFFNCNFSGQRLRKIVDSSFLNIFQDSIEIMTSPKTGLIPVQTKRVLWNVK